MRGIHPGQVWRCHPKETLWRVVDIRGGRVVLVDYFSTRTRTAAARVLYGRPRWGYGWELMTASSLAMALEALRRRA